MKSGEGQSAPFSHPCPRTVTLWAQRFLSGMSFSIYEIFCASTCMVLESGPRDGRYWFSVCTSQRKAPHAGEYPGNSGALDQPCLLNEANSPLCGAISYVKTSLLFPAPGAIQYFFPRIGLLQIVKSTELFTSHIASSVKLNDNLSWVTELAVRSSKSL